MGHSFYERRQQMLKITTIVGARPQLIKAAAFSQAVKNYDAVTENIVHTGQHYDPGMSDIFFKELGIPAPAHNLGIGSGPQGVMTGRQLEAIEKVLVAERPDVVMVYGDTNSTIAGALAAVKLHIPVAHVEAGLRSFNRRMPEEINRVITDHIAQLLFTPTDAATANLASEGITDGVHMIGDIMKDAARVFSPMAKKRTILSDLKLETGSYMLCTVHRAENTDDPERLDTIFEALRRLSVGKQIVLPLHPRTRKMLEQSGRLVEMTQGLTLIDPVGFLDILALLQGAQLVLTDSGGLQKEAYFQQKRALILRDETEWGELIDTGWAAIAPPNEADNIVALAEKMIEQTGDTSKLLYGDGHAAERIIFHLLKIAS